MARRQRNRGQPIMKLTYGTALALIHNAEKAGSIMGVETMRELMKRLDNPQNKLKVIHI